MSNSLMISIILPVYNGENYIESAILSVLNQTYNNYELIIINDGSTDGTIKILKKFANIDKIKIFNQENKGVSSARNLGISNVSGDILMFLDADDLYLPNYLETVINNWNNELVCVNFLTNGKQLSTFRINSLLDFIHCLDKGYGQLWSKAFSAKIVKENKISFKTNIIAREDVLFISSYVQYISNINFIKKPYYNYKIHIGSATNTNGNGYDLKHKISRLNANLEIEKIYLNNQKMLKYYKTETLEMALNCLYFILKESNYLDNLTNIYDIIKTRKNFFYKLRIKYKFLYIVLITLKIKKWRNRV